VLLLLLLLLLLLVDAVLSQASVYDLYDLLSLCVDQLPKQAAAPRSSPRGGSGAGPVETEALATCARLLGTVAPGSSAHVDLTTEYMVR
jgi:hypothetical protein